MAIYYHKFRRVRLKTLLFSQEKLYNREVFYLQEELCNPWVSLAVAFSAVPSDVYMKTILKLVFLTIFVPMTAYAQQVIWSVNSESPDSFIKDKGVTRQSFPKEFRLFSLDI